MPSSPEAPLSPVLSASAGYEADREAQSFASSSPVDLDDTVEEETETPILNGVTWANQSLRDRPKKYPSLMNLGGRKRKRRRPTGMRSSCTRSITHSGSSSAASSSQFCSCSSCDRDGSDDGDGDTITSESTLVTESVVIEAPPPSSPYKPRRCRARRMVYDSDGQEGSCSELYEGNTCCRTRGQYPYRHRSHKQDVAAAVNANAIPLPFFSTHLPMAPATSSSTMHSTHAPLNMTWPVPNPMAVPLPTTDPGVLAAAIVAESRNPHLMALVGLFQRGGVPHSNQETKAANPDTSYNGLVFAAANDMLKVQQEQENNDAFYVAANDMLKVQQEDNNDAFYVVLDHPYSIAQSLSFSPSPRLLLEANAPHHVVHHNAAYESLEGAERAPNVLHVGYPSLEQAIADLCTRHPATITTSSSSSSSSSMPPSKGSTPRTAVHVHPILTEATVTHYLLEVVASGSYYRTDSAATFGSMTTKETDPNGVRTIVG